MCTMYIKKCSTVNIVTRSLIFTSCVWKILPRYKAQLQFYDTFWFHSLHILNLHATHTEYLLLLLRIIRLSSLFSVAEFLLQLGCCCFSQFPCLVLQVCVPQLQVDGGGKCRLPCASAGLHPPGLPGFRRHLDEAGGQFRQAQTHQQRAGRPGTCKRPFPFILTTRMLVHADTATVCVIFRHDTSLLKCADSAKVFSCTGCFFCCTQNECVRLICIQIAKKRRTKY